MDPLSMMAIQAVSLIGQGIGAFMTMDAAKDYNAAQQRQIEDEMKAEKVRQQQMEMSARRMETENFRKVMQTIAVGTVNAVGQGVSLDDSSVQTGRSQARSQGAWNEAGINANLMFGRQMFSINQSIAQDKIAQANAQMGMQEGQAFGSMFANLGNAFKGFGK